MIKKIEKFMEENKKNRVAVLFAANLITQYKYLRCVDTLTRYDIEEYVFGERDVLESAANLYGLLPEDVGFDWESARDIQRDVINEVCM